MNDDGVGVNDVEVGVNGSSLICLIDSCNGAEGGIGCPKCLRPEKKVEKKGFELVQKCFSFKSFCRLEKPTWLKLFSI